MADFRWPEWWPSNPVGSAYDSWQEDKKQITLLLVLIMILGASLAVIYIWWRIIHA